MKAVVIAVRKQRAAVLLKNGDMRYVENRGYTKGSILELPESPLVSSVPGGGGILHFPRRIVRSAAASFALLFLTGAMVSYACPVSRLTLDSDPAISLAVNCYGRVVDVNAENEENEEIIREIGTRLSGKSVGEASAILTGIVRDAAKAGPGRKKDGDTADNNVSANNMAEEPASDIEKAGDPVDDGGTVAVSLNMPPVSADMPVGEPDAGPPYEDREKEGDPGRAGKGPGPEEKEGEKPEEKAPGKGDLIQGNSEEPPKQGLEDNPLNNGGTFLDKDAAGALPQENMGPPHENASSPPQQNSGEAPKDAGTVLPGQSQGELPQQGGGTPAGQENSFPSQQGGWAIQQDNGTMQQDSGAARQDGGGPPEQDNSGEPPRDMWGGEHREGDGGPSGDGRQMGPGGPGGGP